jgi:hypothetical protein
MTTTDLMKLEIEAIACNALVTLTWDSLRDIDWNSFEAQSMTGPRFIGSRSLARLYDILDTARNLTVSTDLEVDIINSILALDD